MVPSPVVVSSPRTDDLPAHAAVISAAASDPSVSASVEGDIVPASMHAGFTRPVCAFFDD